MTTYTGQVPDTLARPLDWMARMACRDDPELFFDPAREHEARTVCVVHCPVRTQCLDRVMDAERGRSRSVRYGIFAGLTGVQRWRMDPTAPGRDDDESEEGEPAEPLCGTAAALQRHLALGQPVDPACWSAEVRREHGRARDRIRPEPAEEPQPEPRPVTAPEPQPRPRPKRRGRTRRERRIYGLWSTGLSDLDIARRLDTSTLAVKRVRDRLGLLPNLHVRAVS